MRTAVASLLTLAAVGLTAPAFASGDPSEGPEALASWGLEFGGAGQPPHSSWRLALGYRPADLGAPTLSLFRLDGADRNFTARIAGVPVAGTAYRTNQTDTDDWFAYSSSPLTWVWVVVGIGVTAYVIKEVDEGDPDLPSTTGTGGG